METVKKCSGCSEVKDVKAFSNNISKQDGKQGQCKKCMAALRVKYKINNNEKIKLASRTYYEKNKKRLLANNSKWNKLNSVKKTINGANYNAKKINATPEWANLDDIKSWYKLAKMFNKTFKDIHHVDHIIPLNSKTICGLHVENNLQVLTESENCIKSNNWSNHVYTTPTKA